METCFELHGLVSSAGPPIHPAAEGTRHRMAGLSEQIDVYVSNQKMIPMSTAFTGSVTPPGCPPPVVVS